MAEPQAAAVAPSFELRHRMTLALEVAGITREDMATELGVHRNTISNYISGRTAPTRAVLIAWHLRTGVPLRWLEKGDPGSNGDDPLKDPVTGRYDDGYLAVELVAA